MRFLPTPFALACALAAILALAAAPTVAAEPTCQTLPNGTACAETLGGPEAGGAGVAFNVTVQTDGDPVTLHPCVAVGVPCPDHE